MSNVVLGYADLDINYGEPGGGNASRKYFWRD